MICNLSYFFYFSRDLRAEGEPLPPAGGGGRSAGCGLQRGYHQGEGDPPLIPSLLFTSFPLLLIFSLYHCNVARAVDPDPLSVSVFCMRIRIKE